MICPRRGELHALVDGHLDALRQEGIGEHLIRCSKCRDGVRALRRLDAFLSPGTSAPADDAVVARVLRVAGLAQPRDRASAPPSADVRVAPSVVAPAVQARATRATAPSARGARAKRLALAGVTVGLVFLLWPATGPDERVIGPVAGTESPIRSLLALGREIYPDLTSVAVADRGSVLERPLVEAGRGPVFAHQLREAWVASTQVDDRLRLARLAATLRVGSFLDHAADVAMDADPDVLPFALGTVARFGGSAAHRALLRCAARRTVPPGVLADALVLTGEPRSATAAWDALREAGTPLDDSYARLHRIPGRYASAILVAEFLAGGDGPALRRVIVERSDALALLRAELPQAESGDLMRLLGLLSEAVDEGALPHLQRLARRPAGYAGAVKGLSMLARSGSLAGGLALVEVLPLIEDAGDWASVPHRDLLEREFRSLPPGTGSVWLRELSRHRLSVQRKLLVGAGLTGDPEVTQGLVAAIGHSSLRRAALVGLAVLGDRRAARAVGEVLRMDDRSARRGALAALVALGGDEAGRFLSRSLSRSSDRKTVMQLLGDKAGSWAQNVYLDGLPYRDIRESCIAGLRRLSDGRGPEVDSLESWRHWLGLTSDAAPKPGAG